MGSERDERKIIFVYVAVFVIIFYGILFAIATFSLAVVITLRNASLFVSTVLFTVGEHAITVITRPPARSMR